MLFRDPCRDREPAVDVLANRATGGGRTRWFDEALDLRLRDASLGELDVLESIDSYPESCLCMLEEVGRLLSWAAVGEW